jgi:hypothetical protein
MSTETLLKINLFSIAFLSALLLLMYFKESQLLFLFIGLLGAFMSSAIVLLISRNDVLSTRVGRLEEISAKSRPDA